MELYVSILTDKIHVLWGEKWLEENGQLKKRNI